MSFNRFLVDTQHAMKLEVPYNTLKDEQRNDVDELCKFIKEYNSQNEKKIHFLTVAVNQVNDADIEKIVKLESLIELDISNNNITDRGAKLIAQSPHILSLKIGRNAIGDAGVEVLSHSHLQVLYVDHCDISDEGSCHLVNNTSLKVLDLSDNEKITDRSALKFSFINRDMKIRLQKTGISDKCKDILTSNDPLKAAALDFQISQSLSLPDEMKFPSLLQLCLFQNRAMMKDKAISELIPEDIKDNLSHVTFIV